MLAQMTKGILLFPVACSRSAVFVRYHCYNSTVVVVGTVTLVCHAAVLILLSIVIQEAN